MSTATAAAPVRRAPEVPPLPPLPEPEDARSDLPNGLDVWVARRPGAGLTEVRLAIPLGTLAADVAADATARVVAALLFTEATGRAGAEAGRRLAELGYSCRATAAAGSFTVALSGLDENLGEALTILADGLTSTSFASEQVAMRAGRVAAQLEMEGSDPGRIGHNRLRELLFPDHAYGRTLGDPAAAREVDVEKADTFVGRHLMPSGSHLVVVSPREPGQVLAETESSLDGWVRSGQAAALRPPPEPDPSIFGDLLVLDRPESVQTAFWFASRTSRRGDADHAALSIAVLILQKRVYDNIRRRRAWSYAAGSQLIDLAMASYCLLGCPVRTEVTMPAYVELLHEMNRIVSSPVEPGELEEAVGALQGRTAQRMGSRSGLADELARMAESGTTVPVLADETTALSNVSSEEVMHAARRWIAPARTAFVAVGDAEAVAPLLEPFRRVRVESP